MKVAVDLPAEFPNNARENVRRCLPNGAFGMASFGNVKKKHVIRPGGRKLLFMVSAISLLPVCVLLIAFYVPAIQYFLLQAFLKQVEMDSGLQIQYRSHEWNNVAGLRLTGIHLYSSGREFLTCDEARGSIGLSLHWPFIYLAEILLIRPILHLERTSDRQWRLPSGAPGDRTAKGYPPPVEDLLRGSSPRLRIESGQIIAEQDGQTVLNVRNVTGVFVLRVSSGRGGQPEFQLSLANGVRLSDAFSEWLQEAR